MHIGLKSIKKKNKRKFNKKLEKNQTILCFKKIDELVLFVKIILFM